MPLDWMPGLNPGADGPATRGLAITPTDGVALPMVARYLWVGTAGNITMVLRDDLAPVTLTNVPAGLLKTWAKQVWATGTTASGLVALA